MKALRHLTIAAVAAATVPRLVHPGMFVDGVTYASVARNLAEGRGSFWSPSYTATIYPEFHEHPPLGFWLQSLWFMAMGDHLFVERLYTLAAACATGLLIVFLWRRVTRGTDAFECDWLPVLAWIAVPLVSWSIVGNLLETTVSVFTTAAVAAVVYGNGAARTSGAAAGGAVAGLCVVAAALTKGPVGLFPLVAPVILSRATRDQAKWPVCLASQWLVAVICAIGVMSTEAARGSLGQYVDQQVLAALSGTREVSAGSLTIVKELAQGVVVPLAAVSLVVILVARGFRQPSSQQRRWAAALLILGLAGTLPILASAKQAGHYLVPAVPLYACAVAGLLVRSALAAAGRLSVRSIHAATTVIVLAAIVVGVLPAAGRDRRRMAELDLLAPSVPRGATIGICPETNSDWGLHAWFQRRFQASLDAVNGGRRAWFLASPEAPRICIPGGCRPVGGASRGLLLLGCSPVDSR
jgi:4-amino-4-deoxy-L-arabinose transferase-like glycosyltransferase